MSFKPKREARKIIVIKADDTILIELSLNQFRILKRGNSNIFQTFSASTFSMAISFLLILLTEEIVNQWTLVLLKLSTGILFLASIFLFALHRREKSEFDLVIEDVEKMINEAIDGENASDQIAKPESSVINL